MVVLPRVSRGVVTMKVTIFYSAVFYLVGFFCHLAFLGSSRMSLRANVCVDFFYICALVRYVLVYVQLISRGYHDVRRVGILSSLCLLRPTGYFHYIWYVFEYYRGAVFRAARTTFSHVLPLFVYSVGRVHGGVCVSHSSVLNARRYLRFLSYVLRFYTV